MNARYSSFRQTHRRSKTLVFLDEDFWRVLSPPGLYKTQLILHNQKQQQKIWKQKNLKKRTRTKRWGHAFSLPTLVLAPITQHHIINHLELRRHWRVYKDSPSDQILPPAVINSQNQPRVNQAMLIVSNLHLKGMSPRMNKTFNAPGLVLLLQNNSETQLMKRNMEKN